MMIETKEGRKQIATYRPLFPSQIGVGGLDVQPPKSLAEGWAIAQAFDPEKDTRAKSLECADEGRDARGFKWREI